MLASANAIVSSLGLYEALSPEPFGTLPPADPDAIDAEGDEETLGRLFEGLDTGLLLIRVEVVLVDADVLARLLLEDEFTVERRSWISIMWSPSRIVRFNGAFPDKKSTTWNNKKIPRFIPDSAIIKKKLFSFYAVISMNL